MNFRLPMSLPSRKTLKTILVHPFGIMILTAASMALSMASLPTSADDKPRSAASTTPINASAENQKKAETPQYIRIRKNDRKLAVAMETAVVTFSNSPKFPGSTVDLIGAVHLGEPEYYDQLNELFKEYDVVLFEAVMPEEAVRNGLRPGKEEGARRGNLADEEDWNDAKIGFTAISVVQLGMKDALGMEFQLSGVDYTPDNFVHADMTAEEFEESMKTRGESFSGMLLSEMGKSVSSQQKQNALATNLDMMFSAFSSDRAYAIRRIAANQLAKAGETEAFATADGTSTIITERNRKCLAVLDQQLKKKQRKIGIFYGAGHFADMEKRMLQDFEFSRTAEDWIVAWHLRDPKSNTATGKK